MLYPHMLRAGDYVKLVEGLEPETYGILGPAGSTFKIYYDAEAYSYSFYLIGEWRGPWRLYGKYLAQFEHISASPALMLT